MTSVYMELVKLPNKVLRKTAAAVPIGSILTSPIQLLISHMKETLKHTPDGVGLAAPQVGKSLRIFIVSEEAEIIDKESLQGRPSERRLPHDVQKEWKYYVFINPVVKKVSKSKLEGLEGCLSIPGKCGNVRRHEKIMVEAYDESGKKFIRGASKFFARVLQHELDHLDGILFIDRAEKISDNSLLRQNDR